MQSIKQGLNDMIDQISVTILTKNSEETLSSTLDSLKNFSEVLVFDTGSTDSTEQICSQYPNVVFLSSTFKGFGPTHNMASSRAKNDWILSIDSDEILSSALQNELQDIQLQDNTLYSIRRHNFFNQKRIVSCAGWDPDWVTRLYHRKKASFTEDAVHEKILGKGCRSLRLKGPLYHTPYRRISDFLHKMQSYSDLFAEQNKEKKQSSVGKAILHSLLAFFKSYLLKKGVLQGKEGFIISLYNSHCTFYKYLKLDEINK